jgi:4-amino-4-deoxy-L-arabinose transferase-like glycosyltransferase
VIVAFVILGTVIACETPAYESADEPGHVQNIETLVSGHWYSLDVPCGRFDGIELHNCSGDEAHQAPLYYLMMAGWQRVIGVPAHAPYNGQPVFFARLGGLFRSHSAADHRFLMWLRLPNIALGALTVLFTYLAVQLITRDPWTPVVAASFVAFLPRFVFLSAFVTNDNLVNLLGALLVYLCLRFMRNPSRSRIVWVGLAFGALVTTKLSSLPMVIAVVVIAFLATGWWRGAQFAALGVGSALLASSWYLIQNMVRYGDPLAHSATQRYLQLDGGLGTLGTPYVVSNPLRMIAVEVPRTLVQSFWYQSGWNQFFWSLPVNLAITAAFFAALGGLIGHRVDRKTVVALTSLVLAALMSVWVVAFQTRTYEARYAFVGLAAITALAALGVERWRVPIRFILPVAGLIGTVVAVQQDVLSVHWT